MANSTLKKVALYTLGALSGVALSVSVQSMAAEKNTNKDALPVQSIRTMAEVYGQIKANYYQDNTDDELLENAVKCQKTVWLPKDAGQKTDRLFLFAERQTCD